MQQKVALERDYVWVANSESWMDERPDMLDRLFNYLEREYFAFLLSRCRDQPVTAAGRSGGIPGAWQCNGADPSRASTS
eukprot:GSA25T00015169001.1